MKPNYLTDSCPYDPSSVSDPFARKCLEEICADSFRPARWLRMASAWYQPWHDDRLEYSVDGHDCDHSLVLRVFSTTGSDATKKIYDHEWRYLECDVDLWFLSHFGELAREIEHD